jgi:AbrB family looped-hinge helix DNA binding protein
MAKVTSKLQVTVPKAVADHYGIHPGDEIQWVVAGETIRVIPHGRQASALTTNERLRRFDMATNRHQRPRRGAQAVAGQGRGWSREELYRRGRAR